MHNDTGQTDDWDTEAAPRPLKIRCTDSDCGNDLHCFKQTRQMAQAGVVGGTCRTCAEQLVELDRTRLRLTEDRPYLLHALERELIRHHFWHLAFDQKAMDHATRKGRGLLSAAARQRLISSVGSATPFRDGTQTPMEGNTIFYAQHATASCCRTCIEYWHGIPKGRDMSEEEIDYLHDLVDGYLETRLPDLAEARQHVPRRVTMRS